MRGRERWRARGWDRRRWGRGGGGQGQSVVGSERGGTAETDGAERDSVGERGGAEKGWAEISEAKRWRQEIFRMEELEENVSWTSVDITHRVGLTVWANVGRGPVGYGLHMHGAPPISFTPLPTHTLHPHKHSFWQ